MPTKVASAKKRNFTKHRGRRFTGTFLGLPTRMLRSEEWASLNAFEVKLILDIASNFNGSNNGDLCATLSMMKPKGWRSSATLNKSIHGAIEKGFIVCARQGGKHCPSLYALTWEGVDECRGKHDIKPNPVASNLWKNPTKKLD